MSQLRVFKQNGGKVYDLIMAQKKKEKEAGKHALQDELVRELRTAGKRYENTWDSTNITIIQKGHKTALYSGLRRIIGI